jgi:hypothetical protein
MKIWEPKPPGTLWATPGLLKDCVILTELQHKAKDIVYREWGPNHLSIINPFLKTKTWIIRLIHPVRYVSQ